MSFFPFFFVACDLRPHVDWELVFADDEREANPTSFKFLQMAHQWKNSQARRTGGAGLLSGFTAATVTGDGVVDTKASDVSRSDG